MPSSQTNPTELPRFGWPIERKLEPRPPKSLTKAGVSLHAAGDPPLIVRGCRESSQSTRAFCLWITFEDQLSKYAPKGWGPPPDSPTPPPFSIQPISGCGRGMVANKTIKTGEIIVVERPIVVHPATTTMILHHPNGMWGHLEDIYEQHIQLLGEKEQSLYMDLWNCKPVTGTLGNQLVGIARTHYAGVYPKISRCNHSCGPNADAKFDEEKMAMTLIAQRTIPAGDQVTIGYTNLEAPYSARQDDLNTKYIFTCACKHCKPSKPSRPSRTLKHPYWCFPNQTTGEQVDLKAEIDASDVRRDQISHRLAGARELWADWLSPSSRQSDRDLLQFHEDALVIIAQEGLEWTRILDIAYLAHACAALEDEGGFRRWGTMLMSISGTQGDEGKSQMKTWQDWVREPKTSPAWGLRVQARGRTEGTPSRKGKAWHISFT